MDKERLIFSISRFDHYYDSINNKCNVFLTLNTFIVGGLVAAYPWLTEHVNCGAQLHLNMICLIALGMVNIILVTWTSTPFLKKGSDSLLYFGALAAMDAATFSRKSEQETEDEHLKDLRNQNHILARGLKGKFKKLRLAGILFIVQFALFIPLIINIIKNLKP